MKPSLQVRESRVYSQAASLEKNPHPDLLAEPPHPREDEVAYREWRDAYYGYFAAAGYSALEVIRAEVFRKMHPPQERPRPRPAPPKQKPS